MNTADLSIRRNFPLAELSTLGIGGTADYFCEIRNVADLERALSQARKHQLPVHILAGGSNLIIPDDGMRGLVIHMANKGIQWQAERHHDVATVAAGETWDDFVVAAIERELVGVECLSGIPGSVGAVPIQNVGAYGQDVSQVIHEVTVMDQQSARLQTLSNSDCGFAYRDSMFKRNPDSATIVVEVSFRFKREQRPKISYQQLAERLADSPFAELAKREQLQLMRDTVLKLRSEKGMLIDAADPDSKSVGSFFTNPMIDAVTAARLRRDHPTMPQYPAGDKVKLSAAWLIEAAGFKKGLKRGEVGISSKHSLALINRGQATAAELLVLAADIRDGVQGAFGIALEREPIYWGDQ